LGLSISVMLKPKTVCALATEAVSISAADAIEKTRTRCFHVMALTPAELFLTEAHAGRCLARILSTYVAAAAAKVHTRLASA
jgi:hypothetical protein